MVVTGTSRVVSGRAGEGDAAATSLIMMTGTVALALVAWILVACAALLTGTAGEAVMTSRAVVLTGSAMTGTAVARSIAMTAVIVTVLLHLIHDAAVSGIHARDDRLLGGVVELSAAHANARLVQALEQRLEACRLGRRVMANAIVHVVMTAIVHAAVIIFAVLLARAALGGIAQVAAASLFLTLGLVCTSLGVGVALGERSGVAIRCSRASRLIVVTLLQARR
jgi:hypothetical protein